MRKAAAEPPPGRERGARLVGLVLAPVLFVVRGLLAARPHGADAARDRLELGLLDYAEKHDLPVLGICRGAQLMNLSQGGSLLRNVSSFYTERPRLYTTLPRREVRITEGSRLRRALGVSRTRVNSLHFHAVDQPGAEIDIVAREPSGVNQAIEHHNRRFWIGVQWHPEYLPQLRVQQRLFSALVGEARAHARLAARASLGGVAARRHSRPPVAGMPATGRNLALGAT